MQQQPRSRSQGFSLFRSHDLTEIPQVYSWFEQMRNDQPVSLEERMGIWQVFRYEDVSKVITDYAHFSSQAFGVSGSFLKDTLVAKDPPDHRKLRNLVNQAFTPRAVARLSDRITQITQELLGVPADEWNSFQRWARVDSASPAQQADGRSMQEEMSSYFSTLLKERRRAPREDLISALSVAEVDGERLSESDLVSFCILLLAAGQETTKNLIANAIVCLTDHPDAMQRLVSEPAVMPTAIEEILRYLPPVWFLFRQTTTDVELAGQHIPANNMVLAWTASANRDPAQFPEPDRFDIEREPNRHLAFGHGIHFCVGAPLARLEARIVLPMMLEQLKGLQRVEGVPITAHMGIVFVIRLLPVTFQPW